MNRMPFGKHKGKSITDLPDEYLSWLVGLDLREPLKRIVAAEIEKRGGAQKTNGKVKSAVCPSPELGEEIVSVGLRTISQRLDAHRAADQESIVLLRDTAAWMRSKVWGTN